jgi:flagellar hook-basal body complex protein FliE
MISPIPPVTPQLPLLPLVNKSKDNPSFSGLYAAVLQDTTEKIQRKKVELDQKVAQLNTIKKDKIEQEQVMENSPFSMIFAGVVRALDDVSKMEHKTNDLIQRYVDRKASVEEVTMATAQLNVSITLLSTVMSSLSQSFKELQNMQV